MLAINPKREVTFPLTDLARRLSAKTGRRFTYFQLRHWCTRGARRRDKRRIKMDSLIGPGGVESSAEAYYRMIRELNQ